MHRVLPLLLLVVGCATASPPVAELVPPGDLAALMPDSVGAFHATGDEVYRGYFADSTGDGEGAFALVTVARTYMQGAVMMTLNVSSVDRPGRFRALIEAGGARATPDSVVQADQALAAAVAAGWAPYEVQFGRLLLHEVGRAVEAKSMLTAVPAEAMGTVDLARLAALEEAPVPVDTSFQRVALPPPAPRQEAAGVIG